TPGSSPTSACNGTDGDRHTCLGNWPVFYAGDTVVAPTGVASSMFTTFTRASDGKKQTAFNGQPLYYFADDAIPGDVKGLTFSGGLGHWFTVDPTKSASGL